MSSSRTSKKKSLLKFAQTMEPGDALEVHFKELMNLYKNNLPEFENLLDVLSQLKASIFIDWMHEEDGMYLERKVPASLDVDDVYEILRLCAIHHIVEVSFTINSTASLLLYTSLRQAIVRLEQDSTLVINTGAEGKLQCGIEVQDVPLAEFLVDASSLNQGEEYSLHYEELIELMMDALMFDLILETLRQKKSRVLMYWDSEDNDKAATNVTKSIDIDSIVWLLGKCDLYQLPPMVFETDSQEGLPFKDDINKAIAKYNLLKQTRESMWSDFNQTIEGQRNVATSTTVIVSGLSTASASTSVTTSSLPKVSPSGDAGSVAKPAASPPASIAAQTVQSSRSLFASSNGSTVNSGLATLGAPVTPSSPVLLHKRVAALKRSGF